MNADTERSPTPAPPQRALPAAVMIGWIFAAAVMMLLEFQRRQNAQHYQGELFLIGITAMLACVFAALGIAGANLARRRAVGRSLLGAVAALAPLGFWVLVGWYGLRCWSKRYVPNDPLMNYAKGAGASLMEVQARWLYPHRVERRRSVERGRLVMFHHPGLADPQGDADRMAAYLDDLEELIGQPPGAPIHWVRGRLLGQGGMSLFGLALGSSHSEMLGAFDQLPMGLPSLDRHEVAHAYLRGLLPAESDPPTILNEGWAEAAASGWLQAGGGVDHRDIQAEFRALSANPDSPALAELLGPSWYHHDHGPVYSFGPHLVRYLVLRDGFETFRRLCARIRPETVEPTFQELYGATPAMIEQELIRESLAPLEAPPD